MFFKKSAPSSCITRIHSYAPFSLVCPRWATPCTQIAARARCTRPTSGGPSSTIHSILGSFSRALPNSNDEFCVLNRQRGLTLARPTAAPTATSSSHSRVFFNTALPVAGRARAWATRRSRSSTARRCRGSLPRTRLGSEILFYCSCFRGVTYICVYVDQLPHCEHTASFEYVWRGNASLPNIFSYNPC